MRCLRLSPCKINLLLNVLGRRSDGFHNLETVLLPVPIHDQLEFERHQHGVDLSCSDPQLPIDSRNLVHRAATRFLTEAGIVEGIRIQLEKRIPLEAGLGGGSGNAASTLLALNELFDQPLNPGQLRRLAATLGSDVVFFLENRPALATGRGEQVEWLDPFPILHGCGLLLVQPGFGVSTPWAYRELARFPNALEGRAGRALQLIERLRANDLSSAAAQCFNALELPVLEKYPLLTLLQEFLREEGAMAALMSGSGSTTFALAADLPEAERLRERLWSRFGTDCWTAVVSL